MSDVPIAPNTPLPVVCAVPAESLQLTVKNKFKFLRGWRPLLF